jgi:hypothetical protein
MQRISVALFVLGVAGLGLGLFQKIPLEIGRTALFVCLALAILAFLIGLIRRPPILEP